MNTVLDLIVSDVEMALASKPQRVDDAREQDNHEEEMLKKELMTEIKELNRKHEELLASISNI